MAATLAQVRTDVRTRIKDAPTVLVGADLGNATAIAVGPDGKHLRIPSYLGIGDLDSLLSARGGSGDVPRLDAGEYVLQLRGVAYYVGNLALEQLGEATTGRGDMARYTTGHTLRLLLTLLGTAYGPTAKVRLVTGVPPSVADEQPQIRQQIRQHLVGTHTYRLLSHTGSVDAMMEIEKVAVMSEAQAVYGLYGAPGEPFGILDIGGHTTDIAWFDRSGRIVGERTRSVANVGVSRIGALLSEWFRREYGRRLSEAEQQLALAQYREGEPVVIFHHGRVVVERGVMAAFGQEVARQINSFLARHWTMGASREVASDAVRVVVIGGGPHYIDVRRDLQIDTEQIVPDAPELANALAYAAAARRIDETQKWPK